MESYVAKILIDGFAICPGMTGVGRYVVRTLEQFLKINQSMQFYLAVIDGTPTALLPQADNLEYLKVSWINHFWHTFVVIPKLVRRIKPDLVFIPYDVPVGFFSAPYVMAVHDVPDVLRSAQRIGSGSRGSYRLHLRDWLFGLLVPRALRKAEFVIAVSHYIAAWLEKEVKIDPSKLLLAPYAPGADFKGLSQKVKKDEVWSKLGTPQGFILVIYTGDARENIGILPEIYHKLVDQSLPQHLVIAGVNDYAKPKVISLISGFSWRDRVKILPFITPEKVFDLVELYHSSSVYFDISLHEGFGMQVIEAMASGTPVVCSDRGALPEVTGDAAILVDPMNVEEIVAALVRVLGDETFRQELIKRGYDRSEMYSWPRTAKIIFDGLKRIAERQKIGIG
jgi:glycosyltransferase involved in cell wall biosynthesis